MKVKKPSIPIKDEFVIYYSKEDESWIAHSLRTDQMGLGDCVVDALADLMLGLHNLHQLAKTQKDIQIAFEAPDEIKKIARQAKHLDDCILEIAFKKFCKTWPKYYNVHIDISQTERLTGELQDSIA